MRTTVRLALVVLLPALTWAVTVTAAGQPSRNAQPLGGHAVTQAVDAYGRGLLQVDGDGVPIPATLAPAGGPALAPGVAAAAGDTVFLPYTTYMLPNGADALAIGDVTGDGRPDVVAVNTDSDSLYVLAQMPNGMLSVSGRYGVNITYQGTFEGTVAIADINHDGRLDAVVGMDNAVGVMLQNAGGTLAAAQPFASAHSSFTNVFKLATGDFNHDGRADVSSIDWGTQSHAVDLFRQAPAGMLLPPLVYTSTHGGYDDLEAGDVNGDGRDDLVVMSGQLYAYPTFGVLTQAALGGFNPATYYALGWNELSRGVGVGDVNGDGRGDVVVAYGGNKPGSGMGIFYQNPGGTLGSPLLLPSYDIPGATAIADVTMDGLDDVMVMHNGWLQMGVYRQDGTGGLLPEGLYPVPYASWYNAHGLAVADLNGDFRPDAAIADYNGVEVLYNRMMDVPVPALVQRFDGQAGPDGVLLSWQVAAGTVRAVERSEEARGEWSTLTREWQEAADGARFLDRTTAPGTSYLYRLRMSTPEGGEVVSDAILVNVGSPLTRAGLQFVGPSPARGELSVEWSSSQPGPTTLRLLDVQGRSIATLLDDSRAAGFVRETFALPASLRAGVYLLCFESGSVRSTRRVVVVR